MRAELSTEDHDAIDRARWASRQVRNSPPFARRLAASLPAGNPHREALEAALADYAAGLLIRHVGGS